MEQNVTLRKYIDDGTWYKIIPFKPLLPLGDLLSSKEFLML